MGIGASIFLIAVGLILALAVNADVAGVDLQTIGWILTAVGVIGLVMTMVIFAPRRRRATVIDRGVVDGDLPVDDLPRRQVVRERTIDEGPY